MRNLCHAVALGWTTHDGDGWVQPLVEVRTLPLPLRMTTSPRCGANHRSLKLASNEESVDSRCWKNDWPEVLTVLAESSSFRCKKNFDNVALP